MTHQKIDRRRGLRVAKEGDIADENNEYAISNNGSEKPLAEGDDKDDDKYNKDSNISDNSNKDTVGNDGVNKPLVDGNNKYDALSVLPAHKRASFGGVVRGCSKELRS